MTRTKKTVFAILTPLVCAVAFSSASAKTVTVTELNGNGLSVSGELLSYDGDTYQLRTSLGDLELSVLGSICAGTACPAFVEEEATVSVADATAESPISKKVTTN